MTRALQRLLLGALLAACVGCASAPRPAPLFRPLPEAARSGLHQIEVLIGVGQQEIALGDPDYASLPLRRSGQWGAATLGTGLHSGGRGGRDGLLELGVLLSVGLIGAALGLVVGTGEAGVEAYQGYMASRAAAPLQRSAAGFDFGARLREALLHADGQPLWLNKDDIRLVEPATPQNFAAHHAMSAHDAVLLIALRPALSTDLNTLRLKADVWLIPRSDALWRVQYQQFRPGQRMDRLPGALATDPLHALYRRVMYYETRLNPRVDDRDKAAASWAGQDGALLRSAFDEGLGHIARLLAADLSGQRAAASPVAPVVPLIHVDGDGVTRIRLRD